MKIFIEVQIGYRQSACMFYEKILNRKINYLHEQSLGIVYRASTISFYALQKKKIYSFTSQHKKWDSNPQPLSSQTNTQPFG